MSDQDLPVVVEFLYQGLTGTGSLALLRSLLDMSTYTYGAMCRRIECIVGLMTNH
jgi:hypothetical protein